MAEARHKPPMQPWLAPVSNRLFGWTENGCEGTSPSAELRFQHSASPPSAAGRFPRLNTLPPRLLRARPPQLRPGPAPAPAPPRPAACAKRPPLREPGERSVGLARHVLQGSGLFAEPGLPRARSRALLRSVRTFFPQCFPRPLRSVISQAFLSLKPPPSPTWTCLTRLSAAYLRLDFLRRGSQGQKPPGTATPELPGGLERQLPPGLPSAPRVFLVSLLTLPDTQRSL